MGQYLAIGAFVAGAVVLFGAQSASAQTMKFGEDEAEEAMGGEQEKKQEKNDQGGQKSKKAQKPKKNVPKGEVSKTAKQFLKEGKGLYKKKKYDQASLIFYKIVKQQGVSAKGAIPEARYQLAKTLLKMKLYQGALTHFGKIVKAGKKHPYFAPTLNGLLTLSKIIPADPTLRKHLASYADLFPDNIPEKHRDRYAYLTGRHFYGNLNVKQASRMFKAVSQESKYYAKANYILGTTHVANYSAKPAVAAFKEVLRYLTPKKENGNLSDEQKKIFELTNLAMARVFYSTGDYGTALKYYDKVGRDSPRWPKALFEESWAYFQLDRYNRALGNLHSLNSPFFRESYFPEGPILAAVIFFYNCKYERVRNQLDEFEYLYEPYQDDMKSVLDANKGGTGMYKWYRKLQKGKVDLNSDARRIIEAALEDRQVQSKFQLVQRIDDELEKIKSMPGSWKTSKLGQSLIQGANLAKSFAQDEAGSLARQRLKRRLRKLNDLINQKKKIKFEIARAKKGNLAAEIPSGEEIKANRRKAGKLNVSEEQMYWEFNGEYWRDELGHYVFNIGSECQR